LTRPNRGGPGAGSVKQHQGHAGASRPGSGTPRRAARAAESELAEVYELPLEVKSNGARALRPASDPGAPPETDDIAALRAWLVSLRDTLKRGGLIR
jgi:hypothetical protein